MYLITKTKRNDLSNVLDKQSYSTLDEAVTEINKYTPKTLTVQYVESLLRNVPNIVCLTPETRVVLEEATSQL